MQLGSLIAGLTMGIVLGAGGAYGVATLVDRAPSDFDQDMLESTLRDVLGAQRARIVRCHQSDGPFWVCRVLTQPRTGKLYNITIAPNGRCFTGVEAETAMQIDDMLAPAVRGWRTSRADCRGTELPGGEARNTDSFAGAVIEARPTAFPALVNDSDEGSGNCDPNYAGACLDPESYDYDCAGGSGDGPDYSGTVEVVGTDVHGLDRDGNGVGCD